MSDFVQTMKDWRRMCEHCDRNEKIGCVVNGSVCAGFCKMKDEIDLEVVEAKVTAWAAEHPEPVYPTWGEWLMEQMVIAERMRQKYDYTNGEHTDELERTGEYIAIDSEMKKQIPADIAQKLGLKPKENE